MVNCSQHSSQVTTSLIQYDTPLTQLKTMVYSLWGLKEEYSEKSLQRQIELEECLLKFKNSQKRK